MSRLIYLNPRYSTVAVAAVSSKTIFLLLLTDPVKYGMYCVWSWFCGIVLCVISSFVIISLRKRELVAKLYS